MCVLVVFTQHYTSISAYVHCKSTNSSKIFTVCQIFLWRCPGYRWKLPEHIICKWVDGKVVINQDCAELDNKIACRAQFILKYSKWMQWCDGPTFDWSLRIYIQCTRFSISLWPNLPEIVCFQKLHYSPKILQGPVQQVLQSKEHAYRSVWTRWCEVILFHPRLPIPYPSLNFCCWDA